MKRTKRPDTKRATARRSKRKSSKATIEAGSEASSRPFWSGTITFGLVSIPVDLYPASRDGGVSLRMLGPSGNPLQREYRPEGGRRALEDDEIVRGYEYTEGKFVVVTDEELERLAPEKSRDIELQRFVPEEDVDPLYFERGYFLAPAGRSRKAYDLLAESMATSGRAGIATFVMREKEYLVAVFSENGILRAETLRFADEVRSPKSIGLPAKPRTEAARVRAFERVISKSSKKQLPTKILEDTRSKQLAKLASQKLSRKQDVVEVELEAREDGGSEVVDLMAVLRRSLSGSSENRGRKKRAA
jgi:DNA end-binding protein Ku